MNVSHDSCAGGSVLPGGQSEYYHGITADITKPVNTSSDLSQIEHYEQKRQKCYPWKQSPNITV